MLIVHGQHFRLTHWGRVTHICVNKLTIIGLDYGLSPGRRQAIIWTNAGILLIGPLGTNFSEILIEILAFSFKKMHLRVSSVKRRPFCLGLHVLTNECIWEIGDTFEAESGSPFITWNHATTRKTKNRLHISLGIVYVAHESLRHACICHELEIIYRYGCQARPACWHQREWYKKASILLFTFSICISSIPHFGSNFAEFEDS